MLACQNGNFAAASMLVNAAADVNAQNKGVRCENLRTSCSDCFTVGAYCLVVDWVDGTDVRSSPGTRGGCGGAGAGVGGSEFTHPCERFGKLVCLKCAPLTVDCNRRAGRR
jgi:hypothetical protein